MTHLRIGSSVVLKTKVVDVAYELDDFETWF